MAGGYDSAMPPRPHVLVNMAVTADGKIDTVARRGARISGALDAEQVDRLRAEADAALVGGRTLLREDPRLTVRDRVLIEGRLASGRPAQPDKIGIVSRIGLSGERDGLPESSHFLADGGGRVIICTTARTEASTVAWLEDQGGSTLVAGLLADGLVDELRLCIAPVIFGGETAPTPVGGPGWAADAAIALSLVEAAPAADGSVSLRYRLTEGAPA